MKINCCLHKHDFVNEVQVMVQVFFPGAKFAFVSSLPQIQEASRPGGDDLIHILSFWEIPPEGVLAETLKESSTAIVYKNGAEISRHTFCQSVAEQNKHEFLNPRRVVMLALYHALQKAVGAQTPWGALTGIRPSKLVREWLANGTDDEQIIARLKEPFCCSEEKAKLALTVARAEERLTRRIFGAFAKKQEQKQDVIGIYVSVPFCPSRCIYCSFNMVNSPADANILEQYVTALICECRKKAASLRDSLVSSVYIGGGTPTVLPEYLLEKLLDTVSGLFCNGEMFPEFTVEAGRPDTLTAEKLKIMRKYGVNRIAVNPQTLNDRTLAAIGRDHTAADFFRAFDYAREAGFSCINTDLIAGLPGETLGDMRRNMEALARLLPENITIHTLAVKRASRLIAAPIKPFRNAGVAIPPFRGVNNEQRGESSFFQNIAPPISKVVESMLHEAAESCASMGFLPYYLYRQKNMVGLFENVGYSLPGSECLYNIGMMAEVQTILGIGAGAVSKYVRGNKITREFNVKNPEIYISRALREC
ncbi:MAG: coproporphyrinogen dehydrogenase HemZ [Defluviitaleaceae bacterium]|nr:coproporphyrinogen dehydrogenase HemZ [Defluviitaleaceae bacterium]